MPILGSKANPTPLKKGKRGLRGKNYPGKSEEKKDKGEERNTERAGWFRGMGKGA